jgi:hypothetical protein
LNYLNRCRKLRFTPSFQRFKMNFATLNHLELPIIRFIELPLFLQNHFEPLFPPTTTYQEPFWAVTRSPI